MVKILEFIFDEKKIHQVIFLLPIVSFYLTNRANWLLLTAVIILGIMEVYKTDLENKVPLFIAGRIKQKKKNKPLFRNWKDQLKDAGQEFKYIYNLRLFGIVSLIFIAEFIYSTILSYSYNKILFGVHIFLIVYILFLESVINYNFELLSKRRKKK